MFCVKSEASDLKCIECITFLMAPRDLKWLNAWDLSKKGKASLIHMSKLRHSSMSKVTQSAVT